MEQVIRNIIKDIGLQDWNPLIQLSVTDAIYKYFTDCGWWNQYRMLNNYFEVIGLEFILSDEQVADIINKNLSDVSFVSDHTDDYGQNLNKRRVFVVNYLGKLYSAHYEINSYGDSYVYDFSPFKEVLSKEEVLTVYE